MKIATDQMVFTMKDVVGSRLQTLRVAVNM